MPKIIRKCKYCLAVEEEISHSFFGKDRHITLRCGHSKVEKGLSVTESEVISDSGKKPYPFQYENRKNIEELANGRALISDEMGLGKTTSALITVASHLKQMSPVLCIVKSSLVRQWEMEIVDWCEEHAFRIENSKNMIPIGFKFYVVSYDLLPRFKDLTVFSHIKTIILDECQQIKNSASQRTEAVRSLVSGKVTVKRTLNTNVGRPKIEMMAHDLMIYHGVSGRFELAFETLPKGILGQCESKAAGEGIIKGRIVLDKEHCLNSKEDDILETIVHEIAHAITPSAGHSGLWSQTCKDIGGTSQSTVWCEGISKYVETMEAPKYLLALSGTPIKNSGYEYFPILNMLRPELFRDATSFGERYLNKIYSNGGYSYKYGGLRADMEEDFRNRTSDFIFRHTRDEVLPDLPKVRRLTRFSDLGEKVEEAYSKMFDKFMEEYDADENTANAKFSKQANLLGYMNKMRHLTGLSKVEPCTEYVKEFLETTDRPITIFVHHKDVAELMVHNLKEFNPLNLNSSLDSDARQNIVNAFREGKSRILIASTLAAGEGLNLQFCSDCIMLERQWNPANEEQAEGRFTRIGSVASSIDANYFVATGTIDEFFATLVEEKRHMVKATLDGNDSAIVWNESSIMKELADTLARNGKNRWKLN